MMNINNKEDGALIVEATMVFPIMFLIIFLMLFVSNAYFQKCKVETIVQKEAIQGAAYCSDPMLDNVMSGNLPGIHDLDVKPYRYVLGGMNDIVSEIEGNVQESVNNIKTGFFSEMIPSVTSSNVAFENHFIYSTFEVEVDYKIKIPLKMLWADDYYYIEFCSFAKVPVSDTPEFIRNVDMVEDYLQRYLGIEGFDFISRLADKAKEWLHGGN